MTDTDEVQQLKIQSQQSGITEQLKGVVFDKLTEQVEDKSVKKL